MKLGLCEVCYIKPVATMVTNMDNATRIAFGTPLSVFMMKLYKIGFTIAMCIVVLKAIQLIICLATKKGDAGKYISDLKRSVLGAILLALVPRADEILDFFIGLIF